MPLNCDAKCDRAKMRRTFANSLIVNSKHQKTTQEVKLLEVRHANAVDMTTNAGNICLIDTANGKRET